MLSLAEEAAISGKGVALKHGKFIGPPMVKIAQQVRQRHE